MSLQQAEFDRFADEYGDIHARNITASGESPEFFSEYKVLDLARECHRGRVSKPGLVILDLGSGVGNSVPFVRRYLPESKLVCADVSAKSLCIGRKRFRDEALFVQFDGLRLPLADDSVDIAFAACVFHHIPQQQHRTILGGFHRVVRNGGLAFIFERNPWNPLTRRAVDRCVFDENAG
jgi:ubiquinone/menaquinone biosynthesis C-methylase UbiE